MMKTQIFLSHLLGVLGITAIAANAASSQQVEPGIHKACLDAKDYAGCVQIQAGSVIEASKKEECWKSPRDETWCIAQPGVDRFGLPKLEGWAYWIDKDGDITYEEAIGPRQVKYYKTNHKIKGYRYVATNTVWRYYERPTAGTSGYSSTIGSAQTYCNSYGAFASCTTTPAPTITIPGTPGSPGGVRTVDWNWVFDCKDKTVAGYRNKRLGSKWSKEKDESLPGWEAACSRINEIPELNLTL